jgi:hypothetical protein
MLSLVRPRGAAVCPTLALEGLGREAGLEAFLGSAGSAGIGKKGGSLGVRMPCIAPRTSSILPSCCLLELALQVVGHVPELADGMAEAAHRAR